MVCFQCIKNINKHINEYYKENRVSEDEKELIKIHKRNIVDLFKLKSYDEVKKRFYGMLNIIDENFVVTWGILINKIMPYFKTYFLFLIDGKVTKTTNKIEIIFLKTFSTHVNKIMNIFKGSMRKYGSNKEFGAITTCLQFNHKVLDRATDCQTRIH